MKIKENKLALSVIYGTVVGISVTLALTVIFAFVITSTSASLKLSGFFATFIVIVGSFISGLVASRIKKENGLITGAVCGGVYYIILVLLTLVFLKSAATASLFIKLVLTVFSASVGGIVGVNKNNSNKLFSFKK